VEPAAWAESVVEEPLEGEDAPVCEEDGAIKDGDKPLPKLCGKLAESLAMGSSASSIAAPCG
jgi:hypothetical protein